MRKVIGSTFTSQEENLHLEVPTRGTGSPRKRGRSERSTRSWLQSTADSASKAVNIEKLPSKAL